MKLLLFQFGSEWLILKTNDFHLKILAKLIKISLYKHIHVLYCCGFRIFNSLFLQSEKKMNKPSVDSPIFKYNAFYCLYTLI